MSEAASGQTGLVFQAQDRPTATERPLPRRRFFNDMPDKGLFALCAVLGSILIITLKLAQFNPEIVALLAGIVMITYGTIAYHIPDVQLRLDRLGDNFYYLGFVYTLASMSAALLQLRRGTDIEALLGSFGIALFSTIIGVAGRVLFAQMRNEIDEVEAAVRRDLLASANDLRAQLSISLRDFETFHTAVQQAASESAADMQRLNEAHIEGVCAVATSAANHIKGLFDSNEAQARELAQTILQIARIIDEFSQRLASFEFPPAQLKNQIATFGQELDSIITSLKNVVREIETSRSAYRRPFRFWPFKRRG